MRNICLHINHMINI